MLVSDAARCQLIGSRSVATECDNIVVGVTREYRHASQVACVRQELDVDTERRLVSSVALRRRRR